jgi:hypothetical protein
LRNGNLTSIRQRFRLRHHRTNVDKIWHSGLTKIFWVNSILAIIYSL